MTPDILRTTYLQMTERDVFRPVYSATPHIEINEAVAPHIGFYRFLYEAVGAAWKWYDRRTWSDEKLFACLSDAATRVYVLYVAGTPAGYIELDCQVGATEIAYFGLMSSFFGRGYGSHLLSFGVERAWDLGAKRVWVHTCNLDGPHAIRTYEKVGFTVYDVTEEAMPAKYLV